MRQETATCGHGAPVSTRHRFDTDDDTSADEISFDEPQCGLAEIAVFPLPRSGDTSLPCAQEELSPGPTIDLSPQEIWTQAPRKSPPSAPPTIWAHHRSSLGTPSHATRESHRLSRAARIPSRY